MKPETHDRILDAAEKLFSDAGFDATSIRQIVAAANVNLAAVHYHFHSKEALLDAVVARRAGPVNAQRIVLLDAIEAEAAGQPVPVERILVAFLQPVLDAVTDRPHVSRLIARIHAEGHMARLMRTEFAPVVARFLAAFRKSLPHLPPDEIFWRVGFTIGAMAASINGPDLPVMRGYSTAARARTDFGRLVAFLAAGFRAPSVPRSEESR
jgi:AcrR family transcriptional regulator